MAYISDVVQYKALFLPIFYDVGMDVVHCTAVNVRQYV